MAEELSSIISHISVGTNDFERATEFYDQVLATVGAQRVLDFPGAAAYGKTSPEFWVQTPINGLDAASANGSHICFVAPSRDAVDAFYDAAIAAGGEDDGPPGPRPDYGEGYYACFVRDLDGHKIEAALIPD
ncbi:MAG: VOC family protein [Gammaproteobacteria bacterium]|jgi:catechol 2,3-dioxygenase-like lactoylglutathione lyase family enzyme